MVEQNMKGESIRAAELELQSTTGMLTMIVFNDSFL